MIRYSKENIFETNADAVVNTVNTVGIMGKGIALQFKEYFPLNFSLYKKACKNNEVVIGKMFVTETNQISNPRYIINFPTKAHWKQKSSYQYIESGLDDLINVIREKNIKSIAVPPLGCGNGGLNWKKVQEILEKKLQIIQSMDIVICEPGREPEKSKIEKPSVTLTQSRAMILDLIKQYTILGYETTFLEIQKLAYFLQRVGEPLRLQYKKDFYGPYAYNLQHLLKHLEGNYIDGDKNVADSKPFDKVKLVDSKFEVIQKFIQENCSNEQKTRLNTVYQLIEGFESPFGMELLSTVDWVLKENAAIDKIETIVTNVHSWNTRKQQLMKSESIAIAYNRLRQFSGYLNYN